MRLVVSSFRRVLIGAAVLLLVAAIAGAQPSNVTVLYVDADATGANDGSSWADALVFLQDGLAAATGPDVEIWVAEGEYFPDQGATQTDNDIAERFELRSDVPLFGGFTGTETSRDQRNPDPSTNNTILSGDIGGGFQSRNVVYAEGITGTVVDGFTIRGARNEGVPEQGAVKVIAADRLFLVNLRVVENDGLGVHIRGTSDVTLAHVEIADNGDDGIGVDDITTSDDATVRIVDSVIRDNGGAGGAFGADAIVMVINTLISGHTAPGSKGMTNSGLLTVQFCTFTGNGTPTQVGGGIANGGTSGPRGVVVTGSLFEGNQASLGGGIHNTGAAIVVGNTFLGNVADQQGGGLYNHAAAGSLELHNTYFLGNTAGNRGGAIANFAEFDAMNLVLAGNAAAFFGGGLYNDGTATLRNATVYGNSAGLEGGGAYNDTGELTVLNSVLWNDSAPSGPEIFNALFATTSVGHSDIQGGLAGSADLGSNIDTEPAFVDADGPDDQLGTLDDDFEPMPGSPLVDAGNNDYLLPDFLDLDGDGQRPAGEMENWPNDASKPSRGAPPQRGPLNASSFSQFHISTTRPRICVDDQAFFLVANLPAADSLRVAFGDGDSETIRQPDIVEFLSHPYSSVGSYQVLATGQANSPFMLGQDEIQIEVYSPCDEHPRQVSAPGSPTGEPITDIGAREALGMPVANEPDPTGEEPLRLGAPVPNPARTHTTVPLTLTAPESVRLLVYDVLGREVARLHDGPLVAGQHAFGVDGGRLAPGVYLIRATGAWSQQVQMLTIHE